MEKDKEIKIAIIGKSAAGKSAFIKSFSKHADFIDSEGLAQTTRTYAEYKYYISKDNMIPKIFAKVLNKNDFIEQRVEQATSNIVQKLQLQSLDLMELRNKLKRTNVYVKAVKDSILHMKDFFDIEEFDFLCVDGEIISDGIEKLLDSIINNIQNQELENMKSDDFNKWLQELYGTLYDQLIDKIKLYYYERKILIEDNNELIFRFDLLESERQTLALLLKVFEENGIKKSLTGIITKVIVESAICDMYYDFFKNMRISKLSLIDTFGLDHSQQANSDVLTERYNRIFNIDYPDITVVCYIVALHKGTSSDLQQAISVLYTQRPDLMSYIIGTYIDENNIDNLASEWLIKFDKNTEYKPELQGQILEYLYGDDIVIGLMNNGISENMALKRSEVMRNRFAPFCGKKEKVKSDSLMQKMNCISINALLFSIMNMEHLGSNYIDIDMIYNKLISSTNLEKFIERFIDVATRRFNEIFHKAQARTKGKIKKNLANNILGFDGSTLDATWKRVFRDAYNEVFTKEINIDGNQSFSLADDFGLEGNMKVAFNEMINAFFREWFVRECGRDYYYRSYVNEVDCSKCCKNNNFNNNCIWGVFINCVGTDNMHNKPDRDTVEKWLCDIHEVNKKLKPEQKSEIINIFKEKFKTSFIQMCRKHNARIVSQKIISVQDEIGFAEVKRQHYEEYCAGFDKNVNMAEFNIQVSYFLSRRY